MNFKCIVWILLLFINHVVGEFLQMSLTSVNMSRVIRKISAITITACHMECAKEPACHDIAITERTSDNQLPTCYLLKEDNGHYDEGGNVLTTIKAIGSGVRVDGQWSCWKSISACTVSCGGGVLNQTRDCDSPRPADGGDNCTGPAERTIKCNEQNCQVNGQWGEWKNISSCNVSCGGGVLNQTRDCDSPRPADGGDNCTGPAERTIKCNEQNCPVNGGFGSWKNLTDCSKLCGGGTLEQTRECDSPKPQHGGSDCGDDNRRTVECNTNGCLVVNVALGKIAKQSSTFYVGVEASEAVDGKTGTASYTKFEASPWWQVDMGEVRFIKNISLNAKVHKVSNKDLTVETRKSKDDAWTLCAHIGDVIDQITNIKCTAQPTNARFLRIRSTGECSLYIYEVEIFGY